MSTQQKIKGFIEHHEAYKPGVGPDRLLFVRDNGEDEANATLVLGYGSVFTEAEFAKLKAHAEALYDTSKGWMRRRYKVKAAYRADFPGDPASVRARQGVAEGSAEGQPQAKTDGPTGAGTPKNTEEKEPKEGS